jgi:TrmH family RNA methyltransferase
MISSSNNPKIKLVRTLTGRAKDRRETGAFLAEGVRLLEEALAARWPFQFVLHNEDLSARGQQLLKALQQSGIEAEQVDSKVLVSVSETETSQGILAVLTETRIPLPDSPDFVLILDSIRDPGNLGTLLRTADAAGVQGVLLPPETTDAFAAKVVRAGMGAHFRLPIHTLGWEEIRGLAESLKLSLFLADMHGPSCWETDLRASLALIIGGEAEGSSQAARALGAMTVSVPMQGTAESLNAAVAGSILMFEVMRQRRRSLSSR